MPEILRSIGTIARALDSISNIEFKQYDLTKGQYLYLVRIYEHPGIITDHLANLLTVDRTTAARAVQKLVNQGFVRKQAAANNRKNKELYLTEQGALVYPHIQRENTYSNQVALTDLTPDEAAELAALLVKVSNRVTADFDQVKKGHSRPPTNINERSLMTMTTEIKTATVDDAEALQTLSILAYRDTFDEFNTVENMQAYLEEAYNLPKIIRELQTPDTQFLLLIKDQQFAGYIKLNVNQAQTEPVDPQALEVERLYIHPNFKYQGLGSQLMQLALDTAQQTGKNQVWLGVWEHNEPAQKFYHKWGFERFSQHDFYMGDDRQTDHLMTHRLP